MTKIKALRFCLMGLVLLFSLSFGKAESFDSESISMVSEGIAEWKLTRQDKSDSQPDAVYVSSSLKGLVEKGGSQLIGGVHGLAGLDISNTIDSEIRHFEIDAGIAVSRSILSDIQAKYQPHLITPVAQHLAVHNIGEICMETARGLRIYSGSTLIAGTVFQGIGSYVDTIYRLGDSVQIINPPVYLQNNPIFYPTSRTILGIPDAGTWTDSGRTIHGGWYEETFQTSKTGAITRIHTDSIIMPNGANYYRHIEIKTLGHNPSAIFLATHKPLGNPFSENSWRISSTKIHYSYEINGGMVNIKPLPIAPGSGSLYRDFNLNIAGAGNRNLSPLPLNMTPPVHHLSVPAFRPPNPDFN